MGILNQISWRLFDKTYWHQEQFQKQIFFELNKSASNAVIVVGTSPVNCHTLKKINSNRVKTINFVTDDPWNPAHLSRWYLNSLAEYDLLITPRRSTLNQLKQVSKGKVIYLPFAYNPQVHFEESQLTTDDFRRYSCDIMFFGGADKDRLPYICELIRSGLTVKLYGGYWERYPETRPLTLGIVPPAELRKAVKASKIVLNLVRRSNRDGHVMRSFEVPAMGGCMLNEETEEHIEIFGSETLPFFRTPEEMVKQAKILIKSPELREKFVRLGKNKIVGGENTYSDRLRTILKEIES